jgi:hypothetical protein
MATERTIYEMDADELRQMLFEMADGYQAVDTENTELKGQLAEAQEQVSTFEQLAEEGAAEQEKLFEANARQAFNEICDDLNIKKGLREGAFRSLDFEGDAQDLDGLRSHVKQWFAERPDYVTKVGETTAATGGKLAKDPNAGRGPGQLDNSGRMQVSRAQLQDVNFTDEFGKQLGSGNWDLVP